MNPHLRYMLDTNAISELMRHPQGQVTERIAEEGEDSVCTSIVVAAELRFGAEKKASPQPYHLVFSDPKSTKCSKRKSTYKVIRLRERENPSCY